MLIVDDEPALLRMMTVFLERQGNQVADAATTEAAWSQIRSAPGHFDVVVLDGTMSGIGTEELAFGMLTASPHLRVLAASGYPMDMTTFEAAAPGRVAFLLKPFTPHSLAAAVGGLLGAQEKDL